MTPTSRFRGLTRTVVARAGLAALLAGIAVSPAFAANNLEITALSNRPDKISGGDVLVRIDVPAGVALGDVKVQLNGRDATSQFRPDPSGHALLGLVTGLELGQNQIQASAKKASTSKLKLVNYPITGNNCNDVTSAETVMMVKEHFIEEFGVPRYTVGWGCSGGSIQQYMIGDNFPGLLDGLLPQCSFPDQFGTGTLDARLILNYFLYGSGPGVKWTQDQIRDASGFGTYGQISTQGTLWAARIDPVPNRAGFPPNSSWLYNPVVPVDARYDPAKNPDGARSTTYDHNVNTLGRDKN